MALRDISCRGDFARRYLVCEDGPDRTSTYMECWGAQARYSYRAIADADTLSAARALVSRHGIVMDAVTGRKVYDPNADRAPPPGPP